MSIEPFLLVDLSDSVFHDIPTSCSVDESNYTWYNEVEYSDDSLSISHFDDLQINSDTLDTLNQLTIGSNEYITEIPKTNNDKITTHINAHEFFIKITYNRQKLVSRIKDSLVTLDEMISLHKPLKVKAMIYRTNHHQTKLNLYELSCKLNLSHYDLKITKRIEWQVMKVFGKYCGFEFGEKTWLKSTTERERKNQIEFLFLIFEDILPITRESLKTIITRGTYRKVQYEHRQKKRWSISRR